MVSPQGLRERKNVEVKRALYIAAMDLFRQKGFEETSVDEITQKAGFSRATFFNHFGAKRGILRYYGQELQGLVEQLIEKADPAANPLELIQKVVFTMAYEAEAHVDEVKLICTHSMHDPGYLFDPTPARRRIFEILIELVSAAQRQGQVRRDLPARELALHILFLYQGVVLAIASGLGAAESLLHSMWQFTLGGIEGAGV
jgi:AcrR family transcriptional regulator